MDRIFLASLNDVSNLIEQRQTLDEGLKELAAAAGRSLAAKRCSLMLLMGGGDADKPRLRVCSHFGNLPADAYTTPVDLESSIAGRVVLTREPLLINDVDRSEVAELARQGVAAGSSLICVPIEVAGQLIGVLNVSQPLEPRRFTQADLDLVNVFAAFIGKSIHVFQLQKLSESRLLQMSQVLEAREQGADAVPISPDPARLAKLVAKGFYRELSIAGFGPNAIIEIAAEVLGLLNENLDQHRSRLDRKT